MTDQTLQALLDALKRVADAGPSRSDVGAEMREAPVVLRATLAALVLAAADRPVNGVTLAKAAGYSRGTAYRHNKDALDLIVEVAPALADSILARSNDGKSRSALAREVQERDEAITRLRAELAQSKSDLAVVVSYARDLHEQLAPEFQSILDEKARKVRKLRPVDPLAESSADEGERE